MPEAGITGVGAESTWIQVLEGSTFMLSDERGDLHSDSVGGLFHEDTRYLSRFALRVNEVAPVLLSSGSVDHGSAFFLTNPDAAPLAFRGAHALCGRVDVESGRAAAR